MIKLDTVAIEEFKTNSDFINRIIDENGLKTVKELEDYMNENGYDWGLSKYVLIDIKRTIGLRNRVEREPVQFYPREYKDNSLAQTDELNSGRVLLLNNPTWEIPIRFRGLDNLTIEEIKRLLTVTTSKGDNYLLSKIKHLGISLGPTIVEAVDMYSDQVERQAELAKKRVNYFTFQQSAKKEIVEEEYDDIIEYLLTNTDEFVWGELSDPQKSIIEGSMKNKKQIDRKVREQMVDIVTNYTTKPELEGIAKGKYEPLHRLIKTPNKNNNKV